MGEEDEISDDTPHGRRTPRLFCAGLQLRCVGPAGLGTSTDPLTGRLADRRPGRLGRLPDRTALDLAEEPCSGVSPEPAQGRPSDGSQRLSPLSRTAARRGIGGPEKDLPMPSLSRFLLL